mgnify:CR=1 FL=1
MVILVLKIEMDSFDKMSYIISKLDGILYRNCN